MTSETSEQPGRVVGSCQGSTVGYRIEARSTHRPHMRIGDQTITREWTLLEFRRGPGIPNTVMCSIADEQGLYGYTTAMALMAWAAVEAGHCACVEFRLRRQRLNYSWHIVDDGIGEPIDFDEARRDATFTEDGKVVK